MLRLLCDTFPAMLEHIIIDGNNLLYAMHAHAPIPTVGRETMVKIIERWARSGDNDVSLIFDGPQPRGGLGKQMSSSRINVRFSAPRTADEVIEGLIRSAKHPDRVRVVSSDNALRGAARRRRCRHSDTLGFIEELFPPAHRKRSGVPKPEDAEKPTEGSGNTEDWLAWFGFEDETSSGQVDDPGRSDPPEP